MTAVLAMLAFPAVAVAEGPSASFSVSPENPRSGDTMSFASSSCDPDGRLVSEAWDLDGDGAYDDAEGHTAGTIFTGSGAHLVGLQVKTADGATAVQRRTIMVDTVYALPRPDKARALSPFPVVTLGGRLTPRGARIKLLRVSAPVCSRIRVSCRGRGCPSGKVSEVRGSQGIPDSSVRAQPASRKRSDGKGFQGRSNRQADHVPHTAPQGAGAARHVPQAGRQQGVQMPSRLMVVLLAVGLAPAAAVAAGCSDTPSPNGSAASLAARSTRGHPDAEAGEARAPAGRRAPAASLPPSAATGRGRRRIRHGRRPPSPLLHPHSLRRPRLTSRPLPRLRPR